MNRNFLTKMIAACVLTIVSAGVSMAASKNGVTTIQDHVESLKGTDAVDIRDPMSVFSHVFGSLEESVTVYPTENYFYFQFYKDGISYSGNIRLDTLDRDKGIANFAYFTTYNRWNNELVNNFRQLGKDDGLIVEKLAPLRYRLSFAKKQVVFNLNDLSKVEPPLGKLDENEIYLGPVYDESAIQFYLVYNKRIKQFHYILNQEADFPEVLSTSQDDPKILIGHRTGFAFFRDRFHNRLILIGIFNGNSVVNNYFDGPFDQLPDNFIVGDALRDALIDQSPELKGEIDRWGNTGNGQSRVLVTPYMNYDELWQLSVVTDCVDGSASQTAADEQSERSDDRDAFYRCMDAAVLRAELDDRDSNDETTDPKVDTDQSSTKD